MPARASVNSIVLSPEGSGEEEEVLNSDSENATIDTQDEITDLTSDGNAETLKATQIENFRLRQENKQLKLKAATLVVEKNPKSKKVTKLKAKVPDNIAAFDDEIAKSGRKYGLMISPWISSGLFENITGRPNVDPTSESRYETKTSRANGTIAELYDFLPENLHKIMKSHSHFATIFRHHMQSSRSNAVLSVRQKASLLYNLPQEYFETSYNRASVPELQAMLKIPREKEYSLLPPVLFADCKYDPTMKKLFKNPLLPKMAKIMLCGKSSSNSRSRPQTLSEIWKVTNSTPGLIAFTAVLARFLISPDEELRAVGKISKIGWEEAFIHYKRILFGKSKKVKEVFNFFDSFIFGSSSEEAKGLTTSQSNVVEEFEDAMRAMNFDDDSVSETETDDLHGNEVADQEHDGARTSDNLGSENDVELDAPRVVESGIPPTPVDVPTPPVDLPSQTDPSLAEEMPPALEDEIPDGAGGQVTEEAVNAAKKSKSKKVKGTRTVGVVATQSKTQRSTRGHTAKQRTNDNVGNESQAE